MARLPRVPGKRGTKVGRGGKTANQRLGSMKRRAMKKDFGRRLLKGFGLSGDDFKQSSFVHKKLGLFDKPLSEKKSSSKDIDVPALMTPEKVNNESSPDISAIVKQLNSLLKTANKLGVLTKEQQDAYVQQIKSAKRVAKEQEMEASVVNSGAALAGGYGGIDGGTITPLNDVIQQLAESLGKLTDIVKEKIDEQEEEEPERGFVQRLAEQYGLGDWNKERKANLAKERPTLREGFKAHRTKTGGIRYRDARGRFVKEADAMASKKPGIFSRGASAIKSGASRVLKPVQALASKTASAVGSTITRVIGAGGPSATRAATRVGGAVASTSTKASASTSKIINAMRGTVARGVTKGAAAKVASKEAIERLAKPILAKSIGKTALKSIPILGAVAGLGFAAQKLVEGDVVGAGLDATSGLAGPLTAIPALALSVSRDIYSSLYGVQPEADPEFASRMGVILSAVKAMAANMLKGSVTPKETLSQREVSQSSTPTAMPKIPAAPPQAEKSSSPSASSLGGGSASSGSPASTTTNASIPAEGAKPSGGAPAGGSGGGSIPTPSTSISVDTPASKPAASVQQQTPISMPSPGPAAQQEQPITKTGQAIAQASIENNSMTPSGSTQAVFPGTVMPKPANTPTSRNGARGMGNVPDPTYYNTGMIPAQLYFRQVA